jgi:F-type H+-transporting ATPase subunit b
MALLTPDSGLLFWMLISFGIVVFVLAKFGFPIILKMVEERKAYIEESLLMAETARMELQQVKNEGIQIIADARKEHQAILAEATQLKEKLVKDAHVLAQIEADKVVADSRRLIEHEKNEALRQIRNQVAEISVNIAEKVMRSKLDETNEQQKMIQRLLDEISISKS